MKILTHLVIVTITIVVAYIIMDDYTIRMKEYNKHVCAVYGKQEDCKTPLAPQDRLK